MTSENAEVYPGNAAYPNPTVNPNQPPPQAYNANAAYPNPTVHPNQPPPQANAAYPNPTVAPNYNQPPPPQPYPGYPPADPGMTAYNPNKQQMGPGVPAGGNPPPYQPYPSHQQQPMYAQPPVVQQQSSSNVVVVNSQPTTVPTRVLVARNDQSAFIFAIVVTFILFFCGCWWSLACTIPAMVLGSMASSAGSRGDTDTKGKYEKISMALTVIAIVTQVVGFIIVVGVAVGIVNSSRAAIISSCSSNRFSSNYCFG